MKNYKLVFATIGMLISLTCLAELCPPFGTGKTDQEKHLNILKNHSASIPMSKVQTLPLNMLITRSNKPDRANFREGSYVAVGGFILDFAEEGPESCNCNRGSKSAKTGDVHIALGLSPRSSKKNCVVVEITPKYKKLHPDYTSSLTIGSKVRVYGYLIYDFIHEVNAMNTCTTCGNVWRKTCWEVHPITKIEAL